MSDVGSCILCLECNDDSFTRITTFSSEWIDGQIQKIIEKHMWWWYFKPPHKSKTLVRWMCRQCWLELSAFHKFYNRVEMAHRNYIWQQELESTEHEVASVKVEASERVEAHNTELVLFKDHSKGLLQKEDKFEENAIDIVDIKSEFSFISNDNIPNRSSIEDMCVYDSESDGDSNSVCNEIQSEEDNPLKHESDIAAQDGITPIIKGDRITKEEKEKKGDSNVDHFFKENRHKLECCICNMSLPDFRSLKAHCRNEHNTPGYAMCCGKKFFKRCLLVDHLRVHTDPNFFKCQVCTKTFSTRYVFEMHLETHKIRERKYNCNVCGKSYFKLHVFERHKLTHLPENEKLYSCSQCDKKFASKSIRRYHEDCTHARKYVKICDICGKLFHHGRLFLRHMEEHAGTQSNVETCRVCDAKVSNKRELKKHMKMQHVEENQEQVCPYCSRVSKNCNAHRMHIKYAHTMERKHACHMCNKAFKRPLELKEHLSTHTGEVLYTCPHCPRTFISNANMYKHRRNAHSKDSQEENFINIVREVNDDASVNADLQHN